MSEVLYPFTFTPILKEKVWGGKQLQKVLGKSSQSDSLGESWEIANLPENQSIINNGAHWGTSLEQLLKKYSEEILGVTVAKAHDHKFPLLIKFIDASDDLSVQLHPDDRIAKKWHNSKGKTEMWYVLQAEEGAQIIAGFNSPMNADDFDIAIEEETLPKYLNRIDVNAGDAFFIEAGLIHAIGKGILLAEIQQTSDVTYRVYDYKRPEKDGSLRELHLEEAKRAISYTAGHHSNLTYDKEKSGLQVLKHGVHFKTDIVSLSEAVPEHSVSRTDSFTVLVCVSGSLNYIYDTVVYEIVKGESLLIPAICDTITISSSDAKFLEVYL